MVLQEQGTNWMGYCPFPAQGHDTAGGVTTGAALRVGWECMRAQQGVARVEACVEVQAIAHDWALSV